MNLSGQEFKPLYEWDIHEFKRMPYTYAGDLLSAIPGLRVRDAGLTGQWAPCRIRGSSENQALIFIDGLLFNDPWTGFADLNVIPVEIMDKIEYYPLMNPFGRHAPGGAVNIVTRKWNFNQPFTHVVYRSGSQSFSDLDVTYAQPFTSYLRMTAGVLLKKYGETLEDSQYKAQKTRLQLQLKPASEIEIDYRLYNYRSSADIPYDQFFPDDTVSVMSPHLDIKRIDQDFSLRWNRSLPFSIRITHNASVFRMRDNAFDAAFTYPGSQTNLQAQQQVSNKIPLRLFANWTKSALQPPDGPGTDQSIFTGGIHWQMHLPGLWTVNGQCYLIHPSNHDVKPSLGMELARSRSAFRFSIQWLHSVRPPSMMEQTGLAYYPFAPGTQNVFDQGTQTAARPGFYLADTAAPYSFHLRSLDRVTIPNWSLSAESFHTGQLSVFWQPVPAINLMSTGYLRSVQNTIHPEITDEGIQYRNTDSQTYYGLETVSRLRFFRNFDLSLSGIWSQTIDPEPVPEHPPWEGQIRLEWNYSLFQDDLDIVLMLRARGWSSFMIYHKFEDAVRKETLSSHALLDFKASFNIIDNVTVSYALENLLDSYYELVPGIALPGRRNRLSISWKLYN